MNNRSILILDDTKELAAFYTQLLEERGFVVTPYHTGQALLQNISSASFSPDLLLMDLKLPDMDGLEILEHLKNSGFDAPVIIMTGHGSIKTAVDAMQRGACDFLLKPFSPEKLYESVDRALSLAAGFSTKGDLQSPTAETDDSYVLPSLPPLRAAGFIGYSPQMRAIYKIIEAAAKSSASVFITGETGTGKDICAQSIHRLSPRNNKPFIAINCAAIPRDLLESELFGHAKGAFTSAMADREGAVALAEGGTLFLDEIAEMAPDMQTKLLRFLQTLTYTKIGCGKVRAANVRIVCATNRDPLTEIREGRLREDLYYRLHVIPIHMPPLRERPNDIIDLADYFLKSYAREERKSFFRFSHEAEAQLLRMPWSGNVRELQNIIRGIVVLNEGTTVTLPMLPSHKIPQARNSEGAERLDESDTDDMLQGRIPPLWKIEKAAIERAIKRCAGNIPKAAAMLEVSPSTLYRKKIEWDRALPDGAS
jgi:DNA-binding NtrC family response regulator